MKVSKEKLVSIFKEIVGNDVEVLKSIEKDIFGFDRWVDWRLKVNEISGLYNFCREIEIWNGIISEFNGEYKGINFREVEEDYLNIIKNNIDDEELLKDILEFWKVYFKDI